MKPIKIVDADIAKYLEEIKQSMKTMKTSSGRLTFSVDLEKEIINDEDKAIINISAKAWEKMYMLIQSNDKEIGWHGSCVRGKKPNEYYLSDIYVFPQVVTGSSIRPEEKEYGMWLMERNKETNNGIKFHGHSHVNMGTSPSTTDLTYQHDVVDCIEDFYIFFIMNKSLDVTAEIYDVANNVQYSNLDIKIMIKQNLADWCTEMNKKVTTEVTTYSAATGWGTRKNTPIPKTKKKTPGEYMQEDMRDMFGIGGFYGNYGDYENLDDDLPKRGYSKTKTTQSKAKTKQKSMDKMLDEIIPNQKTGGKKNARQK